MTQNRTLILWASGNIRSDSLAFHLGADCFHINFLRLTKGNKLILAPLRYFLASLKTLSIFLKEKPDIIFVVNPPIFAVLIVWTYCLFSKTRFITDSHSAAFNLKRWEFFLGFFRFFARFAVTNIVHNQPLAQMVAQWGVPVIEIGDIPYHLETNYQYPLSGFNAVFICTFGDDEPVDEVIKAAKELPDVNFYVTGNLDFAPKDLSRRIPKNVNLTGFIPHKEYVALLKGCDLAISLTTRDNTMQNGAYEALDLGIPIITSNWPVLQELFTKGSIQIDNTCEELIPAIKVIRENQSSFVAEINELRNERCLVWNEQFGKLLSLIE